MSKSNCASTLVAPQSQDHVDHLEQQAEQLTLQLAQRDEQLIKSQQQLNQTNQKLDETRADILMLEELGRYLTSSLALDQVIEHIHHSFDVFDADVFLLGILTDDKIEVPVVVVEHQRLKPVDISLSDTASPAVWCVKNKKELLIFEEQDQLKYFTPEQVAVKRGKQMNTIIYQPLVIGDKLVGCLSVQNPEAHAYNSEQIEMIRTLAAYSAIAVANALGYKQLAETFATLQNTQKQLILKEKMASLGTLTAGVAHEINNPVNFAHVGAENLSVDLLRFEAFLSELTCDEEDKEVLEAFAVQFAPLYDHISTIKTGTRRIKNIVQDLRAFTQLDNSAKRATDIVDCIQSTINLIKTQNVDVTKFITVMEPVDEIMSYPAQLNQVFMNIVVNSCDAIREKQRQQESSKLGHITIICRMQQDCIVITIQDNGCGMTEAVKNKIFEPFYTTKVVGKGTGLGMAISFGIIKDHNGSIEVNSTPDKGTLVTVRLPAKTK